MNIYYIDYENVSSQGLKGVEALTENDEVVLLYSKKADNVKIDILTTLMASKARIRFLPVHVGTPNALDFQLVTLLFLNYRPEDYCYIISKDSGYDCCIKTAAENGAPNVERYPNIESAVNKTNVRKTRGRRRTAKENEETPGSNQAPAKEAAVKEPAPERETSAAKGSAPAKDDTQAQSAAPVKGSAPKQSTAQAQRAVPVQETAPLPDPASTQETGHTPDEAARKKPARRRGRKKSSAPEEDAVQAAQPAQQALVENSEPQSGAAEAADTADAPEAEKVQEHVLSQRYLSKQFESRNQLAASALAKSDADKPVSILSVIRRRNDVQLDMHQIDLIREALKNSNNKQQFYSYFVKKLGQKQGIELYHSVKSSYTDLVNANLM